MHPRTQSPRLGAILLSGTLGSVAIAAGLGFAWLLGYDATPAVLAASPLQWPTGSGIFRLSDRPNLLLFAHPLCPCSVASIRELARVLSDEPSLTATVVISFDAEHANDAVALQRQITMIPRAGFVSDLNYREALRFGARSSGQVLLFDRAGRLRFNGGITSSRGHEGTNLGETALRRVLHDQEAVPVQTFPVFGCALGKSALR